MMHNVKHFKYSRHDLLPEHPKELIGGITNSNTKASIAVLKPYTDVMWYL